MENTQHTPEVNITQVTPDQFTAVNGSPVSLSDRMRELAKQRWENKTPEEREAWKKNMSAARKKRHQRSPRKIKHRQQSEAKKQTLSSKEHKLMARLRDLQSDCDTIANAIAALLAVENMLRTTCDALKKRGLA